MGWKELLHDGVNFPPKYIPTGYVYINGKKQNINSIHEEYLIYWFRLKPEYQNDNILKANFIKSLNKLKSKFDKKLLDDSNVKDQILGYSNNFKTLDKVSNKITLDGEIVEINNNVEMPGIFIGKGNHPLRGCIKLRVNPSDVIYNISRKSPLIKKWNNVIHHKNSNFIACWKDNIFGKHKYIYFSHEYENKFKHCYKLRHKIKNLPNILKVDIESNNPKVQECALVTYLIMKFNIRIGHEKDDDISNDSVGCCTLLRRNIIFKNDNLVLSFIGKSNVPFSKSLKIDEFAMKELVNLCKDKKENDCIFSINAYQVNEYLNFLIPSLTAKVFRTYNASIFTFKYLKNKNSLDELKQCSMKVASLCNHKKKGKVELNTSKNNYIDPRIIVSFCKKNNIDIEKFYSQSQLKIHDWARSTSENFKYI